MLSISAEISYEHDMGYITWRWHIYDNEGHKLATIVNMEGKKHQGEGGVWWLNDRNSVGNYKNLHNALYYLRKRGVLPS